MKQSRRQFITQTAWGIAGLTALRNRASAAQEWEKNPERIPPHRSSVVPGVHGYAEQSVSAGGTIHFNLSSTVPYALSICRLGCNPDDTVDDEVLHTFPAAPAIPQSIRPGSYVHVEKNIRRNLSALTIECWVRTWKLRDWAGLVTQSNDAACEFGLFVGPEGRVAFCVGDAPKIEDSKLQLSAKNGVTNGRWYHLVGVWDGKHRSLFINGEQRGKWKLTGEAVSGKLPLRLAAMGRGGATNGFLDGDLAGVAIYHRAHSAMEIEDRFDAKGLAAAAGDGVLAYWNFAEEKGAIVHDRSSHRRHGRVINHGTWMIGGPSFEHEVLRFAEYDPNKDERRGHGLRFASDDLYDCRWKTVHEYRVPANARSGLYVGRIAYEWEGKPQLYHITFIVRRVAKKKKAPILLLASTNTWRAYSGAAFPAPSPTLLRMSTTHGTKNSPGDPPAGCFYRRHAAGQGTYQIGLKMPFIGADPYLLYGAEYSHLCRADRYAHIWLAKEGYEFDVVSDLDLHRDPKLLLGYKAVIINGHSEYWSLPAYFGLENYLNRGGNVMVLSGNSLLWRVSFNDDASIIECRKVDAPGEQMKPHERGEAWHSHDGLRGGMFRENGYPGAELIGLDMLGWVSEAGFGPYVVDATDHFLFHEPYETGLKPGDKFGEGQGGAMRGANGHEVDIRFSTFAALQEAPSPLGSHVPQDPGGITRLANGVSDWTKGSAFDYFFRPIKPKNAQGAEMILWEREKGGKVFNAGSIASGWGIHSDPKFRKLMANVLYHFGVR